MRYGALNGGAACALSLLDKRNGQPSVTPSNTSVRYAKPPLDTRSASCSCPEASHTRLLPRLLVLQRMTAEDVSHPASRRLRRSVSDLGTGAPFSSSVLLYARRRASQR